MSDKHIRDGEPPEDEFQRRARAMIDEEWLAAGVTEEELARSRRAAWAMASRPSAPRSGLGPVPTEGQHGERDHDSFDRLLGLVDDIEAELEAIRVALGAIREALPDSAPSSLDRD